MRLVTREKLKAMEERDPETSDETLATGLRYQLGERWNLRSSSTVTLSSISDGEAIPSWVGHELPGSLSGGYPGVPPRDRDRCWFAIHTTTSEFT